ncbi:unnamed protein product, partial [Symbiodinium sp. CCMP2456]
QLTQQLRRRSEQTLVAAADLRELSAAVRRDAVPAAKEELELSRAEEELAAARVQCLQDIQKLWDSLDAREQRLEKEAEEALVSLPEVLFARAGVRQYNHCIDMGVASEVYAIGPDRNAECVWRPLVKNCGSLMNAPSYTSVTGSLLRWSGTPIFGNVSGDSRITGLHISATPGKVPCNVAVSAPFVSKLLTGDDTTNCPFTGDAVYTQDSCILFTICGRISDPAILHDGAMLRNVLELLAMERSDLDPGAQ